MLRRVCSPRRRRCCPGAGLVVRGLAAPIATTGRRDLGRGRREGVTATDRITFVAETGEPWWPGPSPATTTSCWRCLGRSRDRRQRRTRSGAAKRGARWDRSWPRAREAETPRHHAVVRWTEPDGRRRGRRWSWSDMGRTPCGRPSHRVPTSRDPYRIVLAGEGPAPRCRMSLRNGLRVGFTHLTLPFPLSRCGDTRRDSPCSSTLLRGREGPPGTRMP